MSDDTRGAGPAGEAGATGVGGHGETPFYDLLRRRLGFDPVEEGGADAVPPVPAPEPPAPVAPVRADGGHDYRLEVRLDDRVAVLTCRVCDITVTLEGRFVATLAAAFTLEHDHAGLGTPPVPADPRDAPS